MSQPYYQQPYSGQPPYGYPPQSPKRGPNWFLITLGIAGGGVLLLGLVCCGGIYWLASPPQASAQASQPFELASVPLPAFPDRISNPVSIEPGIDRFEVSLGSQGGYYSPPGNGGILWVYLPTNRGNAGTLPCVLICGAGSTLLEGMSLGEGDMGEHLPYVDAGFAVVAYELDGPNESGNPEPRSYNAFKESRAGLVNARNALEYTLAKVPEVNPKQIFSAGHSSAGTTALLFAAHEPRLAGCIAYAPCIDIPNRFPGFLVRAFSGQLPGLADFMAQSSPKTHESRINCPILLFHAEDDSNVPVSESKECAQRLKGLGKDVTLVTVPTGDHYDSMIDEGIPHGIEWITTHTRK